MAKKIALDGEGRQIYTADAGYSGLKSDTGVTPMSVAEVHNISMNRPDAFEKDGKKYIFGESAVENAIPTSEGFSFFHKFISNIFLIDMKKSGIDTTKPICIKTGMTLLDDKGNNKEKFLHELTTMKDIDENGKEFSLDVVVEMYFQGQGVLYDYYANSTKEDLSKSGRVIVLDLGQRSFDCITFDNGIGNPELSWVDEIGANMYIKEFQKYLIDISGDDEITESEAREVFRNKKFMQYGETVDVSQKIEDLSDKYVETIANKLMGKNIKSFRTASKIILAGGGAEIVTAEKLKKFHPKMFNHVVSPESPLDMSNYRGYKAGIQG